MRRSGLRGSRQKTITSDKVEVATLSFLLFVLLCFPDASVEEWAVPTAGEKTYGPRDLYDTLWEIQRCNDFPLCKMCQRTLFNQCYSRAIICNAKLVCDNASFHSLCHLSSANCNRSRCPSINAMR